MNLSAVLKEFKKLSPKKESLVSVGVFDGVHLGHSKLLGRLVELARASDYTSIVITFTENPKALLNGGNHTLYLGSLDERIELIRSLGVDLITAIPPDHELFQMSARDFVGLLMKYLRMRGMVAGPDFALGRGREGDIKTLQALGRELGFFLEVVPPVVLNGDTVSSTAIRQAMLKGDIPRANGLLGRPFRVRGRVEAGTGKGAQIGFPTANIAVDDRYALPNDGVYCTRASFDRQEYLSVTNIGVCPTIKGNCHTVEVHILDFKGDLYNKEMRLEFVSRLRDEKKFDSVADLCQQIARDIESAREIGEGR